MWLLRDELRAGFRFKAGGRVHDMIFCVDFSVTFLQRSDGTRVGIPFFCRFCLTSLTCRVRALRSSGEDAGSGAFLSSWQFLCNAHGRNLRGVWAFGPESSEIVKSDMDLVRVLFSVWVWRARNWGCECVVERRKVAISLESALWPCQSLRDCNSDCRHKSTCWSDSHLCQRLREGM